MSKTKGGTGSGSKPINLKHGRIVVIRVRISLIIRPFIQNTSLIGQIEERPKPMEVLKFKAPVLSNINSTYRTNVINK